MAAAAAGFAGAEVTFSTWNRAGLDMMDFYSYKQKEGDDDEVTERSEAELLGTPAWGSGVGQRVGLEMTAQTEDGAHGVNGHFYINGDSVDVGDQAKIWTTLGFVRFDFGRVYVDDLRGSIGDWGNKDNAFWRGEDDVFTRFNPNIGMAVALRPINGLFIGASIDATTPSSSKDAWKWDEEAPDEEDYELSDWMKYRTYQADLEKYNKKKSAYTSYGHDHILMTDALKNLQIGAGYTIEDTVQIKAQYIGDYTTKTYGTIELGADLLMIANNLIEVGVKVPLQQADDRYYKVGTYWADSYTDNYEGVRAQYADGNGFLAGNLMKFIVSASGNPFEALEYKAQLYCDLDWVGKYYESEDWSVYSIAPTIGLGGGAIYDLGAFKLGGTLGYYITLGSLSKDTYDYNFTSNNVAGEIFVQKDFGPGHIFAGIADTVCFATEKDGDVKTTSSWNNFKIPVGIEISF